jgi:hypothetical protein
MRCRASIHVREQAVHLRAAHARAAQSGAQLVAQECAIRVGIHCGEQLRRGGQLRGLERCGQCAQRGAAAGVKRAEV